MVRYRSRFARVRLNGRDVYLGLWGSAEAKANYDAKVSAWLANGRRLPAPGPEVRTVEDLGDLFYNHAAATYTKRNRPTTTVGLINTAFHWLYRAGLAQGAIEDFGPLALQAFQSFLAGDPAKRWSRSTINRYCSVIITAFRWGVSQELVPPEQWQALTAVGGLRKGRRVRAHDDGVHVPREDQPVRSAPARLVDATLPHLPPAVRAMVELQRLTGMRPLEVCGLRGADLKPTSRAGVYAYEPADDANKLAHLGVRRRVLLGPRAWAVLKPWADAAASPTAPVFESRDHRGRPRGSAYTERGYAQAIAKACLRAFPPPEILTPRRPARRPRAGEAPPPPLTSPQREQLLAWRREHHWSPHQLRHARATELTRSVGLHAAQQALGHASLTTTLGYVDPDPPEALEAAAATG